MSSDRSCATSIATTLVAAVALVVATAVLPGCGEEELPPDITKKHVALEDVPEAVRKVASSTLKGVKLQESWRNEDRKGQLHSYELRGVIPSNGKVREARISPEGRVLEVE